MIVNRGVAWCSSQTFVVSVRNVLAIFHYILFRQTEVNHVDFTAVLVGAEEEILRFDVPVHKLLLVHVGQPLEDLQPDHDSGLEIKFLAAPLEQFLQTGPQQFLHHNVVVLVLAEIVEGRKPIHSLFPVEVGQQLRLVLELRMLCFGGLQFDGNFAIVQHVYC